MAQITLAMVGMEDGSETYFFDYFLPRVIAKNAIEPLYATVADRSKVHCFYGGEEDWVDKTAAIKLAERYPEKFTFKDVEKGPGHLMVIDVPLMKKILDETTE